MTQASSSNLNSLPGIVTDQPEIFESEPTLSDDTGVNDLDLTSEPTDEAIALIEIPIKQAFSYFAERENEIAKFYVQRYGEYKISGQGPDDETDIERYHRLVSEVNQLLSKFQADNINRVERDGLTMTTTAMVNNLEVLSKQLKVLEFAAEDGSINPTQAGYLSIQSKLDRLKERVSNNEDGSIDQNYSASKDETAKLIRMSALERRLNMMESLLGTNDDKVQVLLNLTKCENLVDSAETLSSWLSLFKPETLQRVNTEIDYLNQRLEKISDNDTSDDEKKQLDSQAKSKLDQLYNLITSTDKYRALVPSIIHRLNAMEELQQKAAQVTTTVNHLEQIQSQIVEGLQSNKNELTSLTEMFAKNIDFIKEFSNDIDGRITALREREH